MNPWRLSWSHRAACLNMDATTFYPDKGGSTSEAKKTCRHCPVRTECLEWALATNEQHGVWGGLSDRERDKLKRRAS